MSGRHKVGDNAPSTKETTTPRAPARRIQKPATGTELPKTRVQSPLPAHNTENKLQCLDFRLSNFVGEGEKIHSAEKKTCSPKGEGGESTLAATQLSE